MEPDRGLAAEGGEDVVREAVGEPVEVGEVDAGQVEVDVLPRRAAGPGNRRQAALRQAKVTDTASWSLSCSPSSRLKRSVSTVWSVAFRSTPPPLR